MKIAHVVDSMEVGGAEMLVLQMCRLQRAEGHDPRVYVIARLGALGEQMLREGFLVQANVGDHLLDSVRNFFRIFCQSRPDIVHLHNPTPTIYAAMAARMAGVPSIVSTRHSLVGPPRNIVVELKYAVASWCCDWIVGICDATTKNLRNLRTLSARKIVRVYNGAIALQRVVPENCPRKSGFTFLYVGRLAPVKNHALLLRAFRLALSSMPELSLWMVGDGSERQTLEEMAAEMGIAGQVTFWGEQLDVARFFSGADAFVMSSSSEGLPISLLQAFSLGLPAIVTDVGGMAEVVRLAQAGYVVQLSKPEELAAAIVRMAVSGSERRDLSTAAATSFGTLFTLQATVTAYAELYRNTRRFRRAKSNGRRAGDE